MPLKVKLRILHRKISPWLVPPLLLLAITGLIYRIGRAWFGMTKETGGEILHLHSGAWLGDHGSALYLLLVGGFLLFLIISGLWMWFTTKKPKAAMRGYHRVLAIAFSLPLILSAVTGIAMQVGTKWLNMSDPTFKLLMSLHQGSWLGTILRPFYILFLGVGLIALCLTGLKLLVHRKISPQH